MTGFGKGVVAFGGGDIRAEIKSFNHKFFELSCKTPEQLQSQDEQIKRLVRQKMMRGKVYMWINYDRCSEQSLDIIVDEKRLQRYYKALLKVKKKFKLKDDVTLDQLLAFPDVIECKPRKENQAVMWKAANAAVKKALIAIVQMRQKEGKALAADLLQRTKNIEKAIVKIEKYIPQSLNRFEKKLKQKLTAAGDENGLRRERLQTEVAVYAKNCDVSEELTRLAAHLSNFKFTLKTNKEAGKVLDFIAQETQREINTVGAKCSDFKIAKEVIFVKGEVEKIREQVQNVE